MTITRDNLPVDMKSPLEPLYVSDFVEDWRMRIWDHAFENELTEKPSFKKSDNFLKFPETDSIIKRVVYRFGFFTYIFFTSIKCLKFII